MSVPQDLQPYYEALDYFPGPEEFFDYATWDFSTLFAISGSFSDDLGAQVPSSSSFPLVSDATPSYLAAAPEEPPAPAADPALGPAEYPNLPPDSPAPEPLSTAGPLTSFVGPQRVDHISGGQVTLAQGQTSGVNLSGSHRAPVQVLVQQSRIVSQEHPVPTTPGRSGAVPPGFRRNGTGDTVPETPVRERQVKRQSRKRAREGDDEGRSTPCPQGSGGCRGSTYSSSKAATSGSLYATQPLNRAEVKPGRAIRGPKRAKASTEPVQDRRLEENAAGPSTERWSM
ncbi:hypothetical protein IAT40_001449 [Kwoniella sp. CBS 6097]